MSFRHEDALWLLLVLPFVVAAFVFAWRMRARASARFASAQNLEALVDGRARTLRAVRSVMLVLGLGLAIVALAGPQHGTRTRILRKRGVDVVIALDFSKSMLARDVRPSRIERAKAEISRLLGTLDGDRIGLVAFAGDTMEFPLTFDYAAATLFFRELGPYDMPVGGTAIGRALTSAGRLLARSAPAAQEGEAKERTRSQVVVLLTDGEDHEGDPVLAARELAEQGVKVFTVAIGSRTGEPIPTFAPDGTWTGYQRDEEGRPITTSLTAEAERQLQEIARVTGGKYLRAQQGTVGVEEIRRALRTMKQEEQKAREVIDREDRYALVLLPAFLLLVLEGILPEAWRRRRKRKEEA